MSQEYVIILDFTIVRRAIGMIRLSFLLEFCIIGILHRAKYAEVFIQRTMNIRNQIKMFFFSLFAATLQELALTVDRPIIDLEIKNPKLFIYVQNLSLVKKLRTNLNDMRRYLTECRIALNGKLLENAVGTKRHLIQCNHMYSIADLIGIENGSVIDFLNRTFAAFEQHIRKCELCSGKGYVCEICKNVEVLFPFDDGAVHCKKCKTVFHRACWLRKNQKCPKCARMELRKSLLLQSEEDEVNANK